MQYKHSFFDSMGEKQSKQEGSLEKGLSSCEKIERDNPIGLNKKRIEHGKVHGDEFVKYED
jgi:hypothetical protein